MRNKKLILIDGSSLLTTSFFGNVPKEYYSGDTSKIMQTSDGRFTNAVFTMSKIILNTLKKQNPTHMVIAWDVNRNTFRREKYPQYKAQRKETKPEIGSQFKIAQELFQSAGIPNLKLEGVEADDIIGTLSTKFEDELPVYIMTKDKDALQLITEKTRVWLNTSKARDMYKERGMDPKTLSIPDGAFEFTAMTFEEEFGINPNQIIDLKAIEGDPSDNIPGVKGVGKETVTKLLQMFGSVEGIYENIEGLNKQEEKEIKESFKEEGIKRSPLNSLLKESEDELVGKKAAILSKELATIKKDIEEYNQLDLKSLELEIDKNVLREGFKDLEFKSLIEKL